MGGCISSLDRDQPHRSRRGYRYQVSFFLNKLYLGNWSPVYVSNHGTFYYNQLAALKILVGDLEGAKNATNDYFSKLYPAQIQTSGEQVGFCSSLYVALLKPWLLKPLEAIRTRPYHYRAYNLAAMIVSGQSLLYVKYTDNFLDQCAACHICRSDFQ